MRGFALRPRSCLVEFAMFSSLRDDVEPTTAPSHTGHRRPPTLDVSTWESLNEVHPYHGKMSSKSDSIAIAKKQRGFYSLGGDVSFSIAVTNSFQFLLPLDLGRPSCQSHGPRLDTLHQNLSVYSISP